MKTQVYLSFCMLISLCSCAVQQQQMKAAFEACEAEVSEVHKSIDAFKAAVLESTAATLHITTGGEKTEGSFIHLTDEEVATLKKITDTLKALPSVNPAAWRPGKNIVGLAKLGYNSYKSIRFLNKEGQKIASLAINHDTDDEHPEVHDAHSRHLPAEEQKRLDELPSMRKLNK